MGHQPAQGPATAFYLSCPALSASPNFPNTGEAIVPAAQPQPPPRPQWSAPQRHWLLTTVTTSYPGSSVAFSASTVGSELVSGASSVGYPDYPSHFQSHCNPLGKYGCRTLFVLELTLSLQTRGTMCGPTSSTKQATANTSQSPGHSRRRRAPCRTPSH
jgi:hypothetical protein